MERILLRWLAAAERRRSESMYGRRYGGWSICAKCSNAILCEHEYASNERHRFGMTQWAHREFGTLSKMNNCQFWADCSWKERVQLNVCRQAVELMISIYFCINKCIICSWHSLEWKLCANNATMRECYFVRFFIVCLFMKQNHSSFHTICSWAV